MRRHTDREGFWNLHARGTPQAGAAFNTALDALTDQIFQQARRQGRHEPAEAYAFDALITMADRAGEHAVHQPAEPGPSAGSASATTPPASAPSTASAVTPVSRRPNPRYLGLLRVDLQALHRGRVEGEELCEIRRVGPIPVPVAEGLLGQAVLHLVITRGVDVLNVTHLGRGPTAAQRIALAWTSPTCTVAGCHRARVEYDHREDYARTRHTRLDELDPLCAYHQ